MAAGWLKFRQLFVAILVSDESALIHVLSSLQVIDRMVQSGISNKYMASFLKEEFSYRFSTKQTIDSSGAVIS